MADYKKCIDPQTWDFIEKTNRCYPTDTFSKSIAEQRRVYDAMCRAFFCEFPTRVEATTTVVKHVPVRSYHRVGSEPAATVIFAHGGGFTVGGLESHDDICAEICEVTRFDVVAIDYRLAPEFLLQDALDDCLVVLEWVRSFPDGNKIVLVGDSAGGYLTALVSQVNRHSKDIAGQVLIYPGLGGQEQGGSIDEHAFAPLLTRAEVLYYRNLTQSQVSLETTSISKFDGLPVTVAISAQCDPLSDEARDYVASVTKARGKAIWLEDKGLVHGHLRARHTVRRARYSFDRVLHTISLMGHGAELSENVLNAFDSSN